MSGALREKRAEEAREKRAEEARKKPDGATAPPQFFPWPPPTPSATKTISPSRLSNDEIKTLGKVAELLEKRLADRGYSDFRYYGVRGDGFALVTRLERIDQNGRPLEGIRRPNYDQLKSIELTRTPFTLQRYLAALIRPGTNEVSEAHFRLFVFLVTTESVTTNPQLAVDLPTIRNWVTLGSLSLDKENKMKPFTKNHSVVILVYEIVCAPPKEPWMLVPSSLPGHMHVEASGLEF